MTIDTTAIEARLREMRHIPPKLMSRDELEEETRIRRQLALDANVTIAQQADTIATLRAKNERLRECAQDLINEVAHDEDCRAGQFIGACTCDIGQAAERLSEALRDDQ